MDNGYRNRVASYNMTDSDYDDKQRETTTSVVHRRTLSVSSVIIVDDYVPDDILRLSTTLSQRPGDNVETTTTSKRHPHPHDDMDVVITDGRRDCDHGDRDHSPV